MQLSPHENFLYHLRSVAEFFFFLIGVLYALCYFFFSNTLFLQETEIFFRLADIPFFISAIAYSFLSIRIRLEEKFLIAHSNENVYPDFFIIESILIFLFVLLGGGFFVANIFLIS